MQIEVHEPEWGARKVFWMDGERIVDTVARQVWVAFHKYQSIPFGTVPYLTKSTGEELQPEHTLATALHEYPGLLELHCKRNGPAACESGNSSA